MTSSAKTLRALERAAMRWYEDWLFPPIVGSAEKLTEYDRKLYLACAAHAAALKRKRTGRR
jgi:hypothetical protein